MALNLKRLGVWLFFFPALSYAQTWSACANTRDVALVLAQAAMVQDVATMRDVSGEEHLKQNEYSQQIVETNRMVTDKPVHVISEFRVHDKPCMEIEP